MVASTVHDRACTAGKVELTAANNDLLIMESFWRNSKLQEKRWMCSSRKTGHQRQFVNLG